MEVTPTVTDAASLLHRRLYVSCQRLEYWHGAVHEVHAVSLLHGKMPFCAEGPGEGLQEAQALRQSSLGVRPTYALASSLQDPDPGRVG